MPVSVLCPDCQRPVERMPVLSEIGFMDYYRCGACSHIYMVAKGAASPVTLPVLPEWRKRQPAMPDAAR